MGFNYDLEYLQQMSRSMPVGYDDPIEDDVLALAYYGSFGLLDPKAPFVDAPAISASMGVPYRVGLAYAVGSGVLIAAAVGWIIDPHHKREGGYDEYYKSPDGDYYGYTSFSGYEEDVPEW